MKDPNQRNLITTTALVVAAVLTVVLSLLDHFLLDGFNSIRALVTFITTFAGSYFMVRYVVNEFIYEKIRLIYKTIHNLKTTKSGLKQRMKADTDILNSVNT